jgi:hypothetical protein
MKPRQARLKMKAFATTNEGQDRRDPIKQVEAPLSDKQEKLGLREVIPCLHEGGQGN